MRPYPTHLTWMLTRDIRRISTYFAHYRQETDMSNRQDAIEGLKAVAQRNNGERERKVENLKKLMNGTYRHADNRKDGR